MRAMGSRALSSLLLTAIIGLLFWLKPNVTPEMFGATTPDRIMSMMAGLALMFLVYLVIQGYPISHGDIGSASAHNLDSIISGVPAIAALFGVLMHVFGFWQLSFLNLLIGMMTLGVVFFDLFIIGGAATKINRLTDEVKTER